MEFLDMPTYHKSLVFLKSLFKKKFPAMKAMDEDLRYCNVERKKIYLDQV